MRIKNKLPFHAVRKENIFTTGISVLSYQRFIHEVFTLAASKSSSYVCFANVHMLMEAYKHPSFSSVVNNADLIAADGKPLSVILRLFKGIKQERICGMDVLPSLLCETERHGKTVFFYGSTPEVLLKMVERARGEYPRLNIVGYYSPPFRELTEKEKEAIVQVINNAHPDLLFVSLGCPKQENWMAEFQGRIHSCMLGLGQAFNTYAGTEKRLPLWMRNLSLEWAYRLYLEPRRLWKRYLYGNSLFLLLVIRHLLLRLVPFRRLTSGRSPQQA